MLEVLVFLLASVPAAFRSRRALVVENALLRHKLAVLTRRTRRRPAIRRRDKLLWTRPGASAATGDATSSWCSLRPSSNGIDVAGGCSGGGVRGVHSVDRSSAPRRAS